jgi:hypothetical protein
VPNDPDELQLGIFLAKLHKTSSFVFWRCDDWRLFYGVQVKRVSPEYVNVRVRPAGHGHLLP